MKNNSLTVQKLKDLTNLRITRQQDEKTMTRSGVIYEYTLHFNKQFVTAKV